MVKRRLTPKMLDNLNKLDWKQREKFLISRGYKPTIQTMVDRKAIISSGRPFITMKYKKGKEIVISPGSHSNVKYKVGGKYIRGKKRK